MIDNANQANREKSFLSFDEHLKKYDLKDVVSIGDSIISIGKLKKNIEEIFRQHGMGSVGQYITNVCKGFSPNKWLNEGDKCEILSANRIGWQKGKIKIKMIIEFIPEEPEENISLSPLDPIRQEIKE